MRELVDAVNRLTQPLQARVRNMLSRAVVKLVNDDGKMQLVQVKYLGVTRDDVERLQSYGFTSVPNDGAEAVVVNLGANSDHPVVIVVEDRRYRLKGLEGGEVAVYNDSGAKLVMKKNGDVELTPKAGQKFKVIADLAEFTGDVQVSGSVTVSENLDVDGAGSIGDGLDVTGDVDASGDVDSGGTVTGSTDVVGGGKHLKTHTHQYSDADTPSGGSGGTKETAAPS